MLLQEVLQMANPGTLYHWIQALPENGRYLFSRLDAEAATNASKEAVQATIRRLKKRGSLVSPRRGFYVVVPPEYRSAGCPPATWFVDDLMQHLGRDYYVALLTAAALHGVGHQQPMSFQVIADAIERDIQLGRVRIEFHVSKKVHGAVTTRLQTETGTMVVATPETTAFDLVRYSSASGYWSNIATVLGELVERIDPKPLVEGARRVAQSDVQRLGWILDFLGHEELASALSLFLQGKRLVATRLSIHCEATSAILNARWKVLVNDEVEPDL
jgi:predicted transcriptional regulator of viral defense system